MFRKDVSGVWTVCIVKISRERNSSNPTYDFCDCHSLLSHYC